MIKQPFSHYAKSQGNIQANMQQLNFKDKLVLKNNQSKKNNPGGHHIKKTIEQIKKIESKLINNTNVPPHKDQVRLLQEQQQQVSHREYNEKSDSTHQTYQNNQISKNQSEKKLSVLKQTEDLVREFNYLGIEHQKPPKPKSSLIRPSAYTFDMKIKNATENNEVLFQDKSLKQNPENNMAKQQRIEKHMTNYFKKIGIYKNQKQEQYKQDLKQQALDNYNIEEIKYNNKPRFSSIQAKKNSSLSFPKIRKSDAQFSDLMGGILKEQSNINSLNRNYKSKAKKTGNGYKKLQKMMDKMEKENDFIDSLNNEGNQIYQTYI